MGKSKTDKIVLPVNYELIFEPDLKKFTFTGKEKITLRILKPTNKIVLNAADLKIKHCHLILHNRSMKPRKIRFDKKNETVTMDCQQKISGNAELFVDFEGEINDKLVGFYRSRYEVQGKKKYLATTQFEPADARRAFPCFDEPAYKATFDVTMVIDKKLTAISNMPIVKQKISKGKKILTFGRSPIMSSYLLYLGVGEYDFLQDKVGKTTLRIVTTPGRKKEAKLAMEFAKKFLKYYEDYFEIKYPLPKLDLIALPDFPEGAMENWGAVTFREAELLYDPKVSDAHTKQIIAEVIAHELVHMWFGNLVTMKWWDNLWLNESFATFMAYKSVSQFYPEFDMWSYFINYWTVSALDIDSLVSSHPIEAEVKTVGQISEIFDHISYAKGASVLRMLEDYLGVENFRKGMKKFLSDNKYGNATTEDLWQALASASKKPVKKVMDTWVKQQGYPIVEASLIDSKLKLAQKRFLMLDRQDKTKWLIPVSIKNDGNVQLLLLQEKEKMIENGFGNFKLNVNQTGFYRVRYSEAMLRKLKRMIETKQLGNIDRFGIQNDLFHICTKGDMHPDRYLDFVRAYRTEDNYLVLKDIADNLSFLYFITFGTAYWSKVASFNKIFFKRLFDRLGWNPKPGESYTDPILRSIAINALGKMGDEKIIKLSREKFGAYLKNPNSLAPDLRMAVYAVVARWGDEETYRKFIGLYRRAKNQEEQSRFLIALGNFKEPKILNEYLNFAMTKDVRSQDLHAPIAIIGGNPYGKQLVLPWIKQNWDKLTKMFAGGSVSRLRRIIESLDGTTDERTEKEVEQFFKKHTFTGTEMTIKQMLEKIKINVKFLRGFNV